MNINAVYTHIRNSKVTIGIYNICISIDKINDYFDNTEYKIDTLLNYYIVSYSIKL